MTQTTKYQEYMRRNLIYACGVGTEANARAALTRLRATKRPAKWLVDVLEGIENRAKRMHPELAAWRNSAPDAPEYMRHE